MHVFETRGFPHRKTCFCFCSVQASYIYHNSKSSMRNNRLLLRIMKEKYSDNYHANGCFVRVNIGLTKSYHTFSQRYRTQLSYILVTILTHFYFIHNVSNRNKSNNIYSNRLLQALLNRQFLRYVCKTANTGLECSLALKGPVRNLAVGLLKLHSYPTYASKLT